MASGKFAWVDPDMANDTLLKTGSMTERKERGALIVMTVIGGVEIVAIRIGAPLIIRAFLGGTGATSTSISTYQNFNKVTGMRMGLEVLENFAPARCSVCLKGLNFAYDAAMIVK